MFSKGLSTSSEWCLGGWWQVKSLGKDKCNTLNSSLVWNVLRCTIFYWAIQCKTATVSRWQRTGLRASGHLFISRAAKWNIWNLKPLYWFDKNQMSLEIICLNKTILSKKKSKLLALGRHLIGWRQDVDHLSSAQNSNSGQTLKQHFLSCFLSLKEGNQSVTPSNRQKEGVRCPLVRITGKNHGNITYLIFIVWKPVAS